MFDPDVVEICGGLYPKTPDALARVIEKLKATGYKIKNLREDEERREGVSAETMEHEGWSLWFASLDNIRFGKCKSCKSLISTLGICVHGHTCEVCGAVTYLNIVDGTSVRFSFIDDDGGRAAYSDVKMKARRWDIDAGYLYLYPEIEGGLWLSGDKAQQYFDSHSDKWEAVEEDGVKLIRLRYTEPWNPDVSVINPSDIMGHKWGHEIVRVWEGKEYGEWGDFPVSEMLSIYEPWHWAPLEPSPHLHEKIIHAAGMVSDCGYYYQDGRAAFYEVHLDRMRLFVEYFTTLDIAAWDAMVRRADKSGPGMIRALAAFCHPNAVVENKPNIGNVLVAVGKIADAMAGRPVTMANGELAALSDAMKDRETMAQFEEILPRLRS